MNMDISIEIRPECLQPAQFWAEPTGAEIQEVLRRASFSGRSAEAFLGLSSNSAGRTVRKWISGQSPIPYSAWALLCHAAGFGEIWVES